jgi:diketogulonate reductase-like aldo/keto reductase
MAKEGELSLATRVRLDQGPEMPIFGLGVWRLPPGEGTRHAVEWALAAGYRLIDTATLYKNEADVGAAVRAAGVPRSEVFVTTKLLGSVHGYDNALAACAESRARLDLGPIDLYLIHWPTAPTPEERLETWRALETIHREGHARAVGVSNYGINHLEEIRAAGSLQPAVNQVEVHPFDYPKELIDYCHGRGIRVMAYSPLSSGARLNDARLARIATAHHRTPAQVLLRWGLQHGLIEIPRSSKQERIVENSHVFDFQLEDAEMAELDHIRE